MRRKIVFVGGVHGAGKSTLCNSIGPRLNAVHHSASELISRFGNVNHSPNKHVANIGKNQDVLVAAINERINWGRSPDLEQSLTPEMIKSLH